MNAAGIAELVSLEGSTDGINPGLGDAASGTPVNAGGTIYFVANDGTNGAELWRVNSSGYAEIVKNSLGQDGIQAGINSPSISSLRFLDGTLYFNANDGTNGNELFIVSIIVVVVPATKSTSAGELPL